MNDKFKQAVIALLKPLSKLDDLARYVPWSVALASKNVYMIIGKIILGTIGTVADMLLLSIIAVQEGIPMINGDVDKYPDYDAKEKRRQEYLTRVARTLRDKKVAWMQKHGTKEALDNYINHMRAKTNNRKGGANGSD